MCCGKANRMNGSPLRFVLNHCDGWICWNCDILKNYTNNKTMVCVCLCVCDHRPAISEQTRNTTSGEDNNESDTKWFISTFDGATIQLKHFDWCWCGVPFFNCVSWWIWCDSTLFGVYGMQKWWNTLCWSPNILNSVKDGAKEKKRERQREREIEKICAW